MPRCLVLYQQQKFPGLSNPHTGDDRCVSTQQTHFDLTAVQCVLDLSFERLLPVPQTSVKMLVLLDSLRNSN